MEAKRYKINEIFHSIQGEGYNAGRAAVFVRFSGCNLRCPFCDTFHTEGRLMTAEDICNAIRPLKADLVVLTGGEPALCIDEDLISAIHALGREIAIETNGTHPIPPSVDHVTCSPKFEFVPTADAALQVSHIDELKVIYNGRNDMALYEHIPAKTRYLQPCDTGDETLNRQIIRATFDYVLAHPQWRLSLQLHKILGVK